MGMSQKLGIAQMTEYDRTRGARARWAECLLCKCTDLNLDPQYPLEDGCGGRGEGVECGVARFQVLLGSCLAEMTSSRFSETLSKIIKSINKSREAFEEAI